MNRASNPLYGKLFLEGVVKCESGLHIGGGREKLEIGGLDAPVIRDPVTRHPYIPGSSFRGKLRSLLERREEGERIRKASQGEDDMARRKELLKKVQKDFYRSTATVGGQAVRIHLCGEPDCQICRLFGSVPMQAGAHENIPSPLLVRDLPMQNAGWLKTQVGSENYTERKMENVLDRVTAHANPREMERVPRDAEFTMQLVYDITTEDEGQIEQDFVNLLGLLKLLQNSSLGGHSVRGYGEISLYLSAIYGRSVAYYRYYGDDPARRDLERAVELDNIAASFRSEADELLLNVADIPQKEVGDWLSEVLSICDLPEIPLEPANPESDEEE
jgi:CRISPR-associated protein Csm3